MAHGKGSRARNLEKRLREKRARKASMKAEYEARRDAGRNQKSKRFIRKNRNSRVAVVPEKILMEVPVTINGKPSVALRRVHGGPKCRNVGCKRCSALFS